MSEIPEIQPAAFAGDWPDHSTILLDVREPGEVAVAAVAGAVHIPMGEIAARLGELDKSSTIVVMCHSGGRSMAVAEFLKSAGYAQVYNLAGGIDAWSRNVDPSVPRY